MLAALPQPPPKLPLMSAFLQTLLIFFLPEAKVSTADILTVTE